MSELTKEELFEKRMDNWRRTVTGSSGSGGGACCASWAEMYLKSRGNGNEVGPPPRAIVTVNQLDGWLVEAAVRSLQVYDEKMALRYWYVFKYPEHWIKTKLLLRRTGVRLVLARAENNLQKVLATLRCLDNTQHHKLHAGVDPRPESEDARGASLTLEKAKASID